MIFVYLVITMIEVGNDHLTDKSSTSKFKVVSGGITFPAPCFPQASSGGRVSLAVSPTLMLRTPWSSPLMTLPAPTWNSKGCPRCLEESKSCPVAKEPTQWMVTVFPGWGFCPLPGLMVCTCIVYNYFFKMKIFWLDLQSRHQTAYPTIYDASCCPFCFCLLEPPEPKTFIPRHPLAYKTYLKRKLPFLRRPHLFERVYI